jgi:hypothetical protein
MTKEKKSNETEELTDTIIFTYDDGTNEEFEIFTNSIEYNGIKYAVLIPLNEDDQDVLISEYDDKNDDYKDVTDEKILSDVYEIFKEKYKDQFDFI